jgi:hypothetical protein
LITTLFKIAKTGNALILHLEWMNKQWDTVWREKGRDWPEGQHEETWGDTTLLYQPGW